MTTPSDDEGRLLLIKKLLNKAEAKGTTEAEREAFSAKAAKLIMQWSIDEALLADADRVRVEKIIKKIIAADAPKTYGFEYARIGAAVARGLGCRGIHTQADGRPALIVVGFESDVDRVLMLTQSLSLQCTLNLGTFYRRYVEVTPWASGTDKYQAKRGFIVGFADGVNKKMESWKRDTVASSAPGTDLVLVDRTKQVDRWIQDEIPTRKMSARSYRVDAHGAGKAAGHAADFGQGGVGRDSGRRAVGR